MTAKAILFLSLFFALSVSLFAMPPDAPKDSIGVAKLGAKIHVRYLVSPGETIYGISTKYHVAVSDLLEINPELENGLKVGQVILIPYDAEAISAEQKKASKLQMPAGKNDTRVVHTVQPGETLYSLAKKYNVSVSDLMKWNNLDLKVGQEVLVELPAPVASDKKPIPTSSQASEPAAVASEPAPLKTQTASQEKQEKITPAPVEQVSQKIVTVKEAVKTPVVIPDKVAAAAPERYDFDSSMQQVLIIPFDPYLYFSDADDEIAARSNINRTKVRQVFRRRMNALLDHPGYENIHLLGGRAQDSLTDLNKIYGSVTYNYQEILYNPAYVPSKNSELPQSKKTDKNWFEKQKDKIIPEESSSKTPVAKDNGKYFGVIIKNPEFFTYFNNKYNIDYYIFVNQFEVKTNYENCLDRAAQNYERTFTTHYSIFDASGKQIAGNKFRTHYNSNSNDVMQIVGDNMQKITARILADLPPPK